MSRLQVERAESGLSFWAKGLLPPAHLLDATWWFDPSTVEAFRSEVERFPPQATVALLGTPSLYLDAWQRGEVRKTLLLDGDASIQQHLPRETLSRFSVQDLFRSVPRYLGADLVIADPPWYVEETMAFLAGAQATAKLGAEVQLCLPPMGTRPTIELERESLFRWADEGGLRLERLLEGKLHYEAPPFERNAYRFTGWNAQEQARSGDLAIFAVERSAGLSVPPFSDRPKWADITLGGTRWRVRESSMHADDSAELVTLGFPGDIFPSCSKRHANRDTPDVWTSGNRAFRCCNPQEFQRILQSLRSDTARGVLRRAERLYPDQDTREARAVAQIVALTELEEREVEALKRCLNGKGK